VGYTSLDIAFIAAIIAMKPSMRILKKLRSQKDGL
jgi:hypothetical protein